MGIYYTDMLDVIRAAGVETGENYITDGWETRARSSGGFANPPLGVMWHHTASQTTIENDLAYVILNADSAPIGNILLDREGVVWPVAAGASNTAGKGGPNTFSRGVCPLDQGNSTLWHIEACNNGVGEPWPQVQIDAYFKVSNAMNAHFGNQPFDIVTHALGAGDGYTDRKVDPAPVSSIQGPWRPSSVTSSGTWSQAGIRSECAYRNNPPEPGPIPIPPTPEPIEENMTPFLVTKRNGETAIIYGSGKMTGLAGNDIPKFEERFGAALQVDDVVWDDFKNKGT